VRILVRWAGFPYAFQFVTLVIFVALAILSWRLLPPEEVPDKLFAKTDLEQLTVWGLWWPAMIWVTVLLGRAWCAVCPLELVANVTERLGRAAGIRQLALGRRLRAGFVIVALYALIQMLVAGVHLHRIPAHTSVFLWGLLATAVAVGLLFKDRAFCRGFCPVGLLLGTYGRGGMLAVRNGLPTACANCTGKGCVLSCNRDRWKGRSCPTLLNPARLDSSQDCLVCGHCITACEPDVMQLQFRSPFHPADARERLASWPVVFFVLMASGFVTYELCTEWPAAKAAFLWVPGHVAPLLGLAAGNGWIKGVWTILLFPGLLWLTLGVVVLADGATKTLGEAWRRVALPLVVVVAAGHMAKGLAKIASWGGFLPGALRDPVGADTALAIVAGELSTPTPLVAMPWVSAVGVLLVVMASFFAVREARFADPGTMRSIAIPVLALATCFGALVLGWGLAV
jgi:hypothetical protein